jgi:protein SCO1/2
MKRVTLALLCLVIASLARAEAPVAPRALREVGVVEHLGAALPAGLTFTDAEGKVVALDSLVHSGHPVLLVLAYARCAMLCSWVLRGVSTGIAGLDDLEVGRDFGFVVVSIDDRETAAEAAKKRDAMLRVLGHGGDRARLAYLRAGGPATRRLADALGFAYAWDPATGQYAHPSVAFVLTPDAHIASYLYGIEFPPDVLGAALESARTGAASGESSPGLGAVLMRCFRFDPAERRHAGPIQTYFHAGSLLLLAGLSALLVGLLRRERRARRPS